MSKTIFTALFLSAAAVASANTMTINYVPDFETDLVDVYLMVEGDNDGVLNYDLSANGLTGVGIPSDGISYQFAVLNNLRAPDFQPAGFPLSNNLAGPSGANSWSAGASQFGSGAPLIGLGKTDVFVEAAAGPPNNFDIDIPFTQYGSWVGTMDLGVDLKVSDVPMLESILGGGGTVFANGAAGTPIALDSPATINVIGIPEPSTCVLAGLALAAFAARRK